MNTPNINILTPLLFLLPILLTLSLYLLFKYLKKKENKVQEQKSQIAFMAETFQELLSKLKEKERELEALKKRAEERAEDVESYSENIIQSVPSGVVSFDNDLRITKVNSAAAELLKISPEEMIGKSYKEVFNPPLKALLEERKPVQRAEYQYKNHAGQDLYLGLTLSVLYNRMKEPIGFVLVFTDLTELKTLEKQIRLREWLSSLGEVSLGIAHELRNPMAVISGYAKMLSKKANGLPEIEAIMKEVRLMDRIIQDFLSFARPIEPNITEIDLKELIDSILSQLLQNRSDIKLSFLSEQCIINSDEVLLKQALTNLVLNAIEAMPQGGTLSVTVSCYDTTDTLKIQIKDTGVGIPDGAREKIFMPFYTTKETGTGLGLSVVHKNITLLGGTVNFESDKTGTSFVISLPL